MRCMTTHSRAVEMHTDIPHQQTCRSPLRSETVRNRSNTSLELVNLFLQVCMRAQSLEGHSDACKRGSSVTRTTQVYPPGLIKRDWQRTTRLRSVAVPCLTKSHILHTKNSPSKPNPSPAPRVRWDRRQHHTDDPHVLAWSRDNDSKAGRSYTP